MIHLPLEGRPVVHADVLDEHEKRRLDDWLESHPDYAELVHRALELERAA